jgi:hypothetical protein
MRVVVCGMASIVQTVRSKLNYVSALAFVRRFGIERWLTLIALLLWCASLFAPIGLAHPIGSANMDDLSPDALFKGWNLLLVGWLGPLACALGWYANIPFAITAIQSFRRRTIGRPLVIIGIILAATAFAPFRYLNLESGAVVWPFLRGPALWLWFCSCGLVWFPVIYKATWSRDVLRPRWRLRDTGISRVA